MKILLIEDERSISSVIKAGLVREHFDVDQAFDGKEGFERAVTGTYSLILLDVMLPGMDGWAICSELRERTVNTPILMLTARDTVDDRVKGLDMGSDDYLPKPFHFLELLARVRSLIRRDRVHKTRLIRVADLEIDTSLRRVTRGGKEINLTSREYTLLEALASHEGQILTRDIIQETVWMDEDSYSNTVDVYIRLLRKKIDVGFDIKLINTAHGLGYVMKAPEAQEAA